MAESRCAEKRTLLDDVSILYRPRCRHFDNGHLACGERRWCLPVDERPLNSFSLCIRARMASVFGLPTPPFYRLVLFLLKRRLTACDELRIAARCIQASLYDSFL